MKKLNQLVNYNLVFVMFLVLAGYIQAQSVVKPKPQVTPSPQITSADELREKWNARWKNEIRIYVEREKQSDGSSLTTDPQTKEKVPDPRTVISFKLDIVKDLLEQTCQNVRDDELKRIRSSKFNSIPYLEQYDDYLVMAFVERLLVNKERKLLVQLLASNPPFVMGGVSIELFFAYKSLDNLFILFDSYEKADTENAKKSLLQILKNTFGDACEKCRIAVADKDITKFIKVSRQWLEANTEKLEVNQYYTPTPETTSFRYGLFRPKS